MACEAKLALVTSDNFRAALTALGMTQRGFASYVGSNERTVRRWAEGTQDIPQWVPVMLALLRKKPPCETKPDEL